MHLSLPSFDTILHNVLFESHCSLHLYLLIYLFALQLFIFFSFFSMEFFL